MAQTDPAQPSPAANIARHVVTPFAALDPSTPLGEVVLRRLNEERLIWLTTVDADGVPQPLP